MSIFTPIIKFLKGAKTELQKVVWPTKQQAINYTLIVIFTILISAVILGTIDYLWSMGLKFLLQKIKG